MTVFGFESSDLHSVLRLVQARMEHLETRTVLMAYLGEQEAPFVLDTEHITCMSPEHLDSFFDPVRYTFAVNGDYPIRVGFGMFPRYLSTFKVLCELASRWDSISQSDQAYISALLVGRRQCAKLFAVMRAFVETGCTCITALSEPKQLVYHSDAHSEPDIISDNFDRLDGFLANLVTMQKGVRAT